MYKSLIYVNNFAMINYVIIALLFAILALLLMISRNKPDKNIFPVKMGDEDIALSIKNLAESSRISRGIGNPPRVNSVLKRILKAYKMVCHKAQDGENLFECEKWLYENFHNVTLNIRQNDYKSFATLPHNNSSVRILSLARLIVGAHKCNVNKALILTDVKLFNSYTPLHFNEICGLSRSFKLAILEQIAEICDKIIVNNKMRQHATQDKEPVGKYCAYDSYLYYFMHSGKQLKSKQFIRKNDINIDAIDMSFNNAIINDCVVVSQAINSIKLIDEIFANGFMFDLSPINEILKKDEIYKGMDACSKESYLTAITQLSKLFGSSERAIAVTALELADKYKAHFGDIIFNNRYAIKTALHTTPPQFLSKPSMKFDQILYMCAVGLVSLVLIATGVFFAGGVLPRILVGISLAICAIIPSQYIVNRLFSYLLPPRAIQRMDFLTVPESGKTLVAISEFISSAEQAIEAVRKLEDLQAVNNDKNIQMCLLIDLPSSKSEKSENDDKIIEVFKTITNKQLSILIRKRTLNNGKYCAYERKRGAIECLNNALLNGNFEQFSYVLNQPFRPEFVMLLDNDSELLVGAVKLAINTMLHPLNEKYDLLTFKSSYKLSSLTSGYSKLFSEQSGIESYCNYSDFFYNLCGKSVFCGKGIYRLGRYQKKLAGKLPQKRILSHDIIEGAILETGALGIVTFEDAPTTLSSDIERMNRWLRGDILLAHFGRKKYCAEPLYRYVIFSNIINSLAPIFAFVLWITMLITSNWWLLFGITTASLLVPLFELGYAMLGIGHNIRFRYICAQIGNIFVKMLWNIATLPLWAVNNFFVWCKTLFKLAFDKENLLEWKTFYDSQRSMKLGKHMAMMLPSAIVMLILCGIFWINVPLMCYALAHIIAINFAYLCGKSYKYTEKLKENDIKFIQDIALKTCDFYSYMLSNDGLLSDNLQIYPDKGISQNTSPTNIGFGLLYPISEFKIGKSIIKECIDKLDKYITLIEKLPKWNGLCFNWYNARECRPVEPYFISSVDSGNLMACMIVAKEFCKEIMAEKLVSRLEKLIENSNLTTLFDSEKNQFTIGYNLKSGKFEGHYDMLASEARMLCYIGSCVMQDTKCWNSLSRAMVKNHGNTLVSWSGTAFEYFMPQLFIKDVDGSMLTKSMERASLTFSKRKCASVWGISESGYYAFDRDMNYLYNAFGISDLSLRSTPDKCVISPYSSAISLKYLPKLGVKNLKKLAENGLLGKYGMYEAIDFTSGKQIIYSYMSHHQGMILCSLVNLLCNNCFNRYFMADSKMSGGKLMLEEKPVKNIVKKTITSDFKYSKPNDWSHEEKCEISGKTRSVNTITNGNYSVVIDNYGCGFSKCYGRYIGKFKKDLYDNFGAFVYLKEEKRIYSPTYAPYRNDENGYSVTHTFEYSEYENASENCKMKVFVPAMLDGEVRTVSVKNDSNFIKNISVAFYEPLSMTEWLDDNAHPCFSDMFISTSFDEETKVLTAHRNSRGQGRDCYCSILSHGLNDIRAESNVANFVGRCNGLDNIEVFNQKNANTPSVGDTLNPCLGLVGELEILPHTEAEFSFVVLFDEDKLKHQSNIKQACRNDFVNYAFASTKIVNLSKAKKYLRSESACCLTSIISSNLLYKNYDKEQLVEIFKTANITLPFGLKAERKFLLLDYSNNDELLKDIVSAVIYCNLCGVECDLVVLYEEYDSYKRATIKRIEEITQISDLELLAFVKLVNRNEINEEIRDILYVNAFEICSEDMKKFEIAEEEFLHGKEYPFRNVALPQLYKSGNGGFDDIGDYYVTSRPNLCYSNVICGKNGGFVVTENGGGFTYFGNSYAEKMTHWSNRPVTDPPSEKIIVCESNSCIRINKLNFGGYVKHAIGETKFVCDIGGLLCEQTQGLGLDGEVKIFKTRFKNEGDTKRNFDCMLSLTPQLNNVFSNSKLLDSVIYKDTCMISNAESGQKMYVKALQSCVFAEDMACIRGQKTNNVSGIKLCKKSLNYNPSHAVYSSVSLSKGEEKTIYFVVGKSIAEVSKLTEQNVSPTMILQKCYFENLAPIKIKSGNKDLDILFNNWLLYQVISSRLNGRCGFYQVGGAIGFRDQLQDCLAMLYRDSEYVAEHILDCAEHQYLEGDVMHWWHKPRFGVRTKISDDKLFLVFMTSKYVRTTGDTAILNKSVRYLVGEPLEGLQEARLEHGKLSEGGESLMSHLVRAIRSALQYGEHGLLLIGGGDWNDALNDIGLAGKGESVWLSMFAVRVMEDFLTLLEDKDKAFYISEINKLRKAINATYKDGYYMRACTDDGRWIGAKESPVAKIDLISQSWAELAEIGDKTTRKSALEHAKELVDEKNGIIKLLSPPFNESEYFGYISSYPQGVRENGGQYTHGAVWYLKAEAKSGNEKYANELLKMLNPIERCRDMQKNAMYKGEPYVISADIYANEDNYGRMGWSWYTGSAGWLYSVIVEQFLGIEIVDKSLIFSKPILENWQNMQVEYRYFDTIYNFSFAKGDENCLVSGGVNYKGSMRMPLKKNLGKVELKIVFKEE